MRSKRVVFFLCLAFLIIFIFAAVVKDILLKRLLADFVRNNTGCKIEMRHFSVNVLKTRVHIKDLVIFNPPGYEEPILLRAPEIYVHFNILDYFKKKEIHLYTLLLDVREYFFIRNKTGQVNGDALLSAFKTKDNPQVGTEQSRPFPIRALARLAAKPEASRQSQGKLKKIKENRQQQRVSIQIDKLTLKIGKIISKDYSKDVSPVVKEFVFNIEKTFDDVRDGYSLVEAVVGKEFRGSILQQFFKLGVQKITHPVEAVKDAGTQAINKTQQVITDIVEPGQKSPEASQKVPDMMLPAQE
ncbi:MAG: hypothetical protein V1662_06570 [Candidatus Omnitrophota bacterium]